MVSSSTASRPSQWEVISPPETAAAPDCAVSLCLPVSGGLLRHSQAGQAALESASGQFGWPVVAGAGRPGTGGLVWPGGVRVGGQDLVKLAAGADGELGEDLGQVVLDRARADEQPGADLRVGQAVAGQPRDLGLLGRQLAGGLDGSLADGGAGGRQLAAGPAGERVDAHRIQHAVGYAQLLAGVSAAALAAQPLAVEQVSAGELRADAGTAQPFDRLPVQSVGGLALAEQGTDEGFDPQRPLGRYHAGALGQPLQRGPDQRYFTGPGCRLG